MDSIQNKYSCSGTNCGNYSVIPDCYPTNAFEVVKDILEAVYKRIEIIESESSPAGTVWIYPGKNGVDLDTGSPVWVKMKVNTTKITDVIKFDYQYLLGAEGLLSVFFDDQLVYLSDERIDDAEEESAVDISLPTPADPGEHYIAFRLDSYNDITSKISVKNIALGKLSREFPWRMFLPAMLKGE